MPGMTRNITPLPGRRRVDHPRSDLESQEPPSESGTPLDPPANLRTWEQVLSLWLEWNEVYERLTEQMFQAGSDPQRIEALLDEADRLRQRATELSRQLLATGEADV